jgi:hypothetical protein
MTLLYEESALRLKIENVCRRCASMLLAFASPCTHPLLYLSLRHLRYVSSYDERKASLLKYHLESSIQRRFPRGLKVHVHSRDHRGLLAQITHQLAAHNLTITRAKVMMDQADKGEFLV